MLDIFKDFIADEEAWDMFITGRAGTGKTTGLAHLVTYCQVNDIAYTVCAFTHKACNVLRQAIPGANVKTLHSFLSKRPTINTEAKQHKHVEVSRKHGDTDETKILFVDEYSMVGEQDLMDIREAQDGDGPRVVWLGDPHQLPPVNDQQSVNPYGKYQVTLTKVYRQAADNPLMAPLNQLVSFIEGATPEPLIESEKFIRKQDISEWYDNDRMADSWDGIMLAYTNKRVQELNAEAEGRCLPELGDKVYSPSNRNYYTYRGKSEGLILSIERAFGEPLALGSKFKTLEHLLTMGYPIVELEDGENTHYFCAIFGHYDYKITKEALAKEAVATNKAIEKKYGVKPALWAKQNPADKLARERAKAWRNFLTFNECVVCLDFTHAQTVHKSQGSTYKNVYLDTEDLAIAAEIDYTQYLKLMYVALSRASNAVITN